MYEVSPRPFQSPWVADGTLPWMASTPTSSTADDAPLGTSDALRPLGTFGRAGFHMDALLHRGPPMKPKIGVYLTDDVAKLLKVAVRRPGVTKSSLVNEALRHFLDPEPKKEHGEEVLQRLRGLAKKHRRIHREVEVFTESFALFVRYFLTITPPLPRSEQNAAETLGRQRFEVFVKQIARRIASDRNLVSEVMRTIVATRPDLVARAAAEAAQHDPATAGTTRPTADDGMARSSKPLEDVAHD